MLPAADVKRALRDAGFEVYGASDGVVRVAERVRENLLMDSGVCVLTHARAVMFVARAQRSDFPGEDAQALFTRVRSSSGPAVARGYREARAWVTELPAPDEPSRALDAWYELQYEKTVDTVEGAVDEVRFAFGLDKTARRSP
jgi:hypothetical protein